MKPYTYSPVPVFDQFTQYVRQAAPLDMGDHMHVGIEVVSANLAAATVKNMAVATEFAKLQASVLAGATNTQIGAAFKVASIAMDAVKVVSGVITK